MSNPGHVRTLLAIASEDLEREERFDRLLGLELLRIQKRYRRRVGDALCCRALPHNGRTIRRAVLALATAIAGDGRLSDAIEWLARLPDLGALLTLTLRARWARLLDLLVRTLDRIGPRCSIVESPKGPPSIAAGFAKAHSRRGPPRAAGSLALTETAGALGSAGGLGMA